MTAAPDNPFHAHLDACHQCRENPFSLCASGAILLQLSATTASAGERAETARLRGDVLRLAQLAAGGSEADFLTAACALAAAISAATAPPVEGLVDMANQCHLWALAGGQRFPFGFQARAVTEEELPGGAQRPWPKEVRPPDLITNLAQRAAVFCAQQPRLSLEDGRPRLVLSSATATAQGLRDRRRR